jgi:hypothetical protein
MCNLYSVRKGQAAIIELARAMHDRTGNPPPLPPSRSAAQQPDFGAYPHAVRGVYGRPRIGVWGRDSGLSHGFYGRTLIS